MDTRSRRPLTRRRVAGVLLGALAITAAGLGAACGDDGSTAGTRDDPFPVKDPRSRCGNLGTSC